MQFPELAPQSWTKGRPGEAGWAGNEDHGDEEDGDTREDQGEDGEDGNGERFMLDVGEGDRGVDEGEGAVIRRHSPESGSHGCNSSTSRCSVINRHTGGEQLTI